MQLYRVIHQFPGDALYDCGWYVWRDGDDDACAGPFETVAEAVEAAEQLATVRH